MVRKILTNAMAEDVHI